MTQLRYIALGGCNTIGEVNNIGAAYPERVAQAKGWQLKNYGYTMCSTREGVQFLIIKRMYELRILLVSNMEGLIVG
ncbi:hypothetical protein [Acinetobacter baumannii]|uniref:hypothetical protein n=1 Tax=Acinetobacter baumannii TaxID=470 RepID=UPI0002BA0CED|nr:hypothetical protein [Acinetobacter baumannii]MCR0075735.1 hypothetical protein [Acinetobacter baumannii]TPS81911.1 hypothetical protein FJU81_13450 [Acinetobacter baumannii]